METAKETGYWQLTVIMVVIASWLLYRYVAPKGWREWSRAGLVQAFIIALYAEMYGFPLTIYVLSGYLGLDIPWLHQSGHLWATLFGWGDLGAMVEMVAGYAFVFFGISLLIEGWREVYRARREGRLATARLHRGQQGRDDGKNPNCFHLRVPQNMRIVPSGDRPAIPPISCATARQRFPWERLCLAIGSMRVAPRRGNASHRATAATRLGAGRTWAPGPGRPGTRRRIARSSGPPPSAPAGRRPTRSGGRAPAWEWSANE